MIISIVIPALNEEKLLPDCLKSLRNQDYRGEYEIIVADNGSTDNTVAIARQSGVPVVSCAGKKGVAHARQLGAETARGDMIIQADADTIYPAGWLSKIARQFNSHPHVSAVAGRFLYSAPPWWAIVEYIVRNYVNWMTALLFGLPLFVSGATFAFRRRAFLAVHGYRGLTYAADQYSLAVRLRKMGPIIYDSGIYVITSPRSVKKPLVVIFRDVLVNVSRWLDYVLNTPNATPKSATDKTRQKRISYPFLLVAFLAASLAAYGYFVPASPVFGKIYAQVAKSPENVIALTFDDGPNEPYTSEILNILTEYNIKATFFVVGANVESYPETARRMLAEGHVIGNHSQNHNANHALSSYGARDMELAQATIQDVLGVSPHLYRPPHGKKSPWELQKANQMGMIVVAWSVAINETRVKPAQVMAHNIVDKIHLGKIILLHDGFGVSNLAPRSDKSLIVEALPIIIEELLADGYAFVTVPELFKVPAYN
ncbi:MAG: polysaccharide deacetylase family protein [Dehalococcoidales bacterium]|nr:polysaccharide deacetylase family protein [Dehalococcoidales bacterium]